jgi:hypothetical protein
MQFTELKKELQSFRNKPAAIATPFDGTAGKLMTEEIN